jgi:hypothetical protein
METQGYSSFCETDSSLRPKSLLQPRKHAVGDPQPARHICQTQAGESIMRFPHRSGPP